MASARQRSVAEILIERKSVRGDIETSGSATENIATYTESSFGTYSQSQIGGVVKASGGALGGGSETLIVHGTQDPIVSSTTAHCLGRNGGQENVLFETRYDEVVRIHHSKLSPTLTSAMGTGGGNIPCVSLADNTIGRQPHNGGNGNVFDDRGVTIRKLTPSECEKLQGFPINYTKIPYRNKPLEDCPDSPRYKAIGNSMAVPVIKWIGERIVNYTNK